MTWQPAGILYPDIEAWAVTYLTTALAARAEDYAEDVHVSNHVPDPRADRMVIVRRDGGVPANLIDVPRLNVSVWGPTEEEVADLTRLVAALLWAAPDGVPATDAEMVGGPVAIADPSGQPRRSMTFEIRTRGEELSA